MGQQCPEQKIENLKNMQKPGDHREQNVQRVQPAVLMTKGGRKVIAAATSGFCYGVQRAVDAAYQALSEQGGRVYTYGPIVHNELVVRDLEKRGALVIPDEESLVKMAEEGTLSGIPVVIRAHGVGQKVYAVLRESGARVIDATCPYVKKIHSLVKKYHEAGAQILVTGSGTHPEVIGILGQIGGDAYVIENQGEAENLQLDREKPVCIVSQTTFSLQKFEDIVAILEKKQYNMDILNTICNATQMRQTEAAELALECDAMIVIGGKNSSNTAKLFEICQSECNKTYFIQSAGDLDETFNSVRCVGITAGASTPKSIIEEVLKYVRDEF